MFQEAAPLMIIPISGSRFLVIDDCELVIFCGGLIRGAI